MSKKNTPLHLKKIPYYLALTLLTSGASLILGLLSFSGMYALLPVLPFAFATFVLSVTYEGEIYLQNIKGALSKLFKNDYLEHHLAKEYILEKNRVIFTTKDCPQFFKDYKAQLLLLNALENQKEDTRQARNTLNDMELWFAQQLCSPKNNEELSPYALELQTWLAAHQQEEWQKRNTQRASTFNWVKGFSALAALFMTLGSTYLIVEAFSVIPFLAAIPIAFWPAMILPMAIIAGSAYGLLTYNAITDLINNDTINKWYKKFRQDLKEGLTVRNVFMTTTAVFLASLALALTVCTAGTWWTIATNSRPLFSWMSKMPSFVMGIINPMITGASAIFFNIENTLESLEMVDQATRSETSVLSSISDSMTKIWNNIQATENWVQIANPFRLLLKVTLTPLRLILFMGHLVSIALTSDRMPGVSQTTSALVALISEGFEDAHYFIGHEHQHKHDDFNCILKDRLSPEGGHNHNSDIPTWLLQTIVTPIYALAALWDSLTSRLNKDNKQVLTFSQAWDKQRGIEQPQTTTTNAPGMQAYPDTKWYIEHTVYLIEKQSKRLAQANANPSLAQEKITQLDALKSKVRSDGINALEHHLGEEKTNPVYNKHRLFALSQTTETQQFINDLPERVGLGG